MAALSTANGATDLDPKVPGEAPAGGTSVDNLVVGVAGGNAGAGGAVDGLGLAADAESAGASDAFGTRVAAVHLIGASPGAGKPTPSDAGSASAPAQGADPESTGASILPGSQPAIAAASFSIGADPGSAPGALLASGQLTIPLIAGGGTAGIAGPSGPVTTNDTFDTISVAGSGLTFNNDFTGTAATDTEFQDDVITAEETLARFWTNSVTMDVTLNDPNQGNNGDLADNSFFTAGVSYSTLTGALGSHDFSSYAEDAVASLPGSNPGASTWQLPDGYARMLGEGGGSPAYNNDSVSLNTYYSTVTSTNDTTIANAMMHEISEGTMGRIGGLGDQNSLWSTMDLFRFNASGIRDYSDGRDGDTTYFSYDGGADLSSAAGLSWNNEYNSVGTKVNGGDTADWTQLDVFGVGEGGETFGLSLTDIEVMDVLGWDPYYTVSAGQTSTGITVETDGGLFVQSGGKVVDTFANGGFADIQSGGVSSDTYIAGSGYDGVAGDETIFAGGVSDYAYIAGGGTQVVFGGEAVSATIAVDANQFVFGDSLAYNTYDYWNQYVYASGETEYTSAFTGDGDVYISGGTAYYTTLSGGAGQFVYSGGLGYEAFIYSGSFQDVESGGTARYADVLNGGVENVYAGGVESSTDIGDGGAEYVYGDSYYTTIAVGGNQYVESGGFAYGTDDIWNQFLYAGGETEYVSALNGDGDQYISGGTAYYTYLSAGGGQYVYGGVSYLTDVASGGFERVLPGGTDDYSSIGNGGSEYVSGDSYYATIAVGGNQYVESGGFAYGTDDIWNQYVYAGGETEYVSALNGDGDQYVSGGTTYYTYLSAGGGELVYSGGVASQTDIASGGFVEVLSGGFANYAEVQSGGGLYVESGGQAYGAVISAGGVAYTYAGGVDSATDVGNGGTQYIYGDSYYATIAVGGNQYVESGGLAYGTDDIWNQFVYAGGETEYVSALNGDGDQYVSGGITDSTYLSAGGGEIIYSGGVASHTEIASGSFENVLFGGTDDYSSVGSGGAENVYGVASGTTVNSGGSETVQSGGLASTTTISGGTLEAASGNTLSGPVIFAGPGGALQIDGSWSPGVIEGGATISSLVAGDSIDLRGIAFSSPGVASVVAGNLLQVTEGGFSYDLQLDQAYAGHTFEPVDDMHGGTAIYEDDTPCYCRGTQILTERGEVAVEDLAIGDKVVTLSGAARPVKWIGRRAYDPRFVAGNRTVLPIRVEAGVLADGVPARDLWVSPEHALHVDGLLVPTRLLVNGLTIRQVESIDRLEYFHIELDSHDVIFADGAAAESFGDSDNRGMFHNAGEFAALYPDEGPASGEFCAPRVAEDSAELAAIRRTLLSRAEALGRTTRDPDLRLVADGDIVRAASGGDGIYRFAVAAGTRRVALVSRSAIPAEVYPSSLDGRALGVPVERVVLGDAGLRVEIGHNSAALGEGFHDDEAALRWSDGRGFLPEGILTSFAGDIAVEVHLAGSALIYRSDPAALAADPEATDMPPAAEPPGPAVRAAQAGG